jgi:hypothetical protein
MGDGTFGLSPVRRVWTEVLPRRSGRCPRATARTSPFQALAGSETVCDLAARHGVSRRFVYQQTHKARTALDDAFSSTTPDEEVLFELGVTKTWLRQVIVALPLICRGSYRGVVEFLRDLLGVPVSLGYVVRPNGVAHQWRKEPPRELSVGSGSYRAAWLGNRLGRSLVIKAALGG